ncbi:sulfate permease [Nostocoides sp. F2B08]|uniref:sulfate permease n=1 Tax=Nostocoides sp. F2B08 TaxID=2653936 RepID=UPI0012630489|nr:sulfate permease [Tetrasphaera sp. F2B08]KAB7742938.1 sulfate permease [Tetrasphaera sp. F2B08]
MLTLCLILSAALYGFMQRYMPTNRAIAWLRTPRGLKWALPIAVIATPAYLGLTALAIQGATRPDLGWLNVLVFLFSWNAMKFAWIGVFSLPAMLRNAIGRRRYEEQIAAH